MSGAPEDREQREVNQQLARLRDVAVELEQQITELVNELEPVMSHKKEEEDQSGAANDVLTCPLANTLAEMFRQLATVEYHVKRIRRRLQV